MGTVGPLVPEIMDSLGISASTAGLVTTLPLVLFAVCAPIAGKLISLASFSYLIPTYLGLVSLGVVLRSSFGVVGLFSGTALIGVGTGALNVTMPAYIRSGFQKRIGPVMGVYSTSMTFASAAIAVLVQILASSLGGWRQAMLSVVSVCIMAFLLFVADSIGGVVRPSEALSSLDEGDGDSHSFRLFSLKNVCIAVYMGLQSLVFYSMLTWYPSIASSLYELPFRSGLLITIMQIASLPPTFLVPVVSAHADLKLLSSSLALLFVPGIAVAWFGGSFASLVVGTVLCGVSLGGSFSMAITFCAVNGRSSKDTAALTSFGQFIGYILASFGPVGIGLSYDVFGSWVFSVMILAFLSAIMAVAGLFAGRK